MQKYKSDNELIFEAYTNHVICNEWIGPVIKTALPYIGRAGMKIGKWLISSNIAKTIIAGGAANALVKTGDAALNISDGIKKFLDNTGEVLNSTGIQICLGLAGVILAGAGLHYVYKLLKSSDTIEDAKHKSTDEETIKLLNAVDSLRLDDDKKMELLTTLISKYHNKLELLANS